MKNFVSGAMKNPVMLRVTRFVCGLSNLVMLRCEPCTARVVRQKGRAASLEARTWHLRSWV